MVHKNLRTLLYYVVGVTAVCLMIEVMMKDCLKPHVLFKVCFSDVVSKRRKEVNKCLK